MPDNSASNRESVKTAAVTPVNESGEIAERSTSSDARLEGQTAENRVARTDAPPARPRRTTLPRTASNMSLLQLLTGLLLAAGLGVRMLRTRFDE